MYKALKKIRNVKVEGKVKIIRPGQMLPADYTPPSDYLKNKIVEEIKEIVEKIEKKTTTKKKNGGKK